MNEPRVDHIMQVGLGFWASKTLLSAVEMELFTELAKHPETLADLSARLGLHPRSARDFLDALVSLDFLERRDGTYYNTPSTDLFLDKRKPSYIGGMLEMANQRLYRLLGQSHRRASAPASRRTKSAVAKAIPSSSSTPTPSASAASSAP